MKYNNIIHKMSALSLLLLTSASLYAQSGKTKIPEQAVKIQLVDNNGKPVANAEVTVGEGSKHIQTNKDGVVNFSAKPTEFITISESGYKTVQVNIAKLPLDGVVTIEESVIYQSEEDNVPLPYFNTDKRTATGDNIVITSEDLKKYPSLDLRNALAALVPGLIISEYEGSTGLYAEEGVAGSVGASRLYSKVGESVRGGAPVYIIDNIPVDITEMPLDPEEVETITIVKDVVGKTIYGPRAANGIIYIKTKRGKSNERILNVNVEKGVQVVDRFPGVASGAEYATINNYARENSNLAPQYTKDDIDLYSKNDPNDLFHPSNDFASMMFKDSRSYQRVNVSSTGGNNFAKYYAYLGYAGEGDNFAIGPDADYNRINVRSNLDMKINDFVTAEIGVFGSMTMKKSPNYKYGSTQALDFNHAVLHTKTVSPIAFPVYVPITGEDLDYPTFGVSSTFTDNPIGNLTESGYYSERGRNGAVNAALNIDLNKFVKGFKSRTFINFLNYSLVRIGKNERYASYTINPPTAESADTTFTEYQTVISASSDSKLYDYYYQHLSGYQQFSYDRTFGSDHSVSASLVYYLSSFTRNGIENPSNEQNANFVAKYSFKNRYTLQTAVTYAGTPSLIGSKQYRYFPSVGASWVVSEENFMKDSRAIDFLKLRAEYGNLGYLSSNPSTFLYENKWSSAGGVAFGGYSGTNRWQGTQSNAGSQNTSYNKWKNPGLDWEVVKEYSFGLDALLFDRRLALTASYYNSLHDGQWATSPNQFPLMSGLLATPTTNFKATRYYGSEFYARYSDNIGEFGYSLGASVVLPRTKFVRYDEPNFREDYLFRTGNPTDMYYGYTYDGVYATDAEAQAVNQTFDATLHAGDFKYVDINNDNVIDANDVMPIGNSSPRAYYTINLALSYKNFDLTIIGDGKAGYDLAKTGTFYQGGWGDNNYSDYIVDNYQSNYPPLTYYITNNNYQFSNYWLQNGNYFKIQNVELAYNLTNNALRKIGLNRVRIFVRGANLATFTNVDYIDPEAVDAGLSRYPLNKTYTGGFNLTF